MKKKKVLSGALIAASVIETVSTAHHSDAVAPPQPHIELEVAAPPTTTELSILVSDGASDRALDWNDYEMLPIRRPDLVNLKAALQLVSQDEATGAPS